MSSRHPRVLVVDEDREERSWLQQILSGVARLEVCDSAAAALETMDAQAVDLVVWGVPDRPDSGPQLLSRLRREQPSTDVVLLTPAGNESELAEAAAGGATIVTRPASATVLRQAAERVLERRELLRRARGSADRLRTVERCADLAPCLDSGEIYPTLLDLLLELLGRHRGVAVFQRPAPLGQALAFRGFSEDESGRIHGVLSGRKPIDPMAFEGVDRVRSGPLHEALAQAEVRAEAAVAVPVRGDAQDDAGVVWVFDDARPFDEEELERADLVRRHAVAALRNAERYQNAKERAFIDDVTEIYNVRYLLSTTENEIQRASRYEKPLSVLFLDLDRFKLVNDRHGHLIGSQTLRNLSQLLLQCVRQVDTLARYGGDEFTILLVDTPHETALRIAERIRRTVADHGFEAGEAGQLQLTISIGVATFPEHGEGRDPLLDAADKAMYRAKSLGRNRVCSATEL